MRTDTYFEQIPLELIQALVQEKLCEKAETAPIPLTQKPDSKEPSQAKGKENGLSRRHFSHRS